jgi:hypothetical protein
LFIDRITVILLAQLLVYGEDTDSGKFAFSTDYALKVKCRLTSKDIDELLLQNDTVITKKQVIND